MTAELMDTLVDHSAGNYRVLMIMGGELLAYGMAHEIGQLDEKCYLEVFQVQASPHGVQEESEGVTMPATVNQALPVVRVGRSSQRRGCPALAGGRTLGRPVGGCDRRCAQMCQDLAGAGPGALGGHRHGVPGQVRRARAGAGPGLSGRGRAAGGARSGLREWPGIAVSIWPESRST